MWTVDLRAPSLITGDAVWCRMKALTLIPDTNYIIHCPVRWIIVIRRLIFPSGFSFSPDYRKTIPLFISFASDVIIDYGNSRRSQSDTANRLEVEEDWWEGFEKFFRIVLLKSFHWSCYFWIESPHQIIVKTSDLMILIWHWEFWSIILDCVQPKQKYQTVVWNQITRYLYSFSVFVYRVLYRL